MNKQLIISLEKAKELYPNADPSIKAVFEETFGKRNLVKDIKDKIQTLQDVYDIAGKPYLPFNEDSDDPVQKSVNALIIGCKIAEAYNEGWKAEPGNSNQPKYYPYKYKNGSNTWVARCSCCYDGTVCPAGLYFKNSNLIMDAWKKFEDVFDDYLMIS